MVVSYRHMFLEHRSWSAGTVSPKPLTPLLRVDGSGYDPYGRLTESSGSATADNPFRFSTKHHETTWHLYSYGHRYYSPELGRWLSRDPFAEWGGEDVYAFVANSPNMVVDALGLYGVSFVDRKEVPGDCGAFSLTGTFRVAQRTGEHVPTIGAVVQEVTLYITVYGCERGNIAEHRYEHYWEAFPLQAGGKKTHEDTWGLEKEYTCSRGEGTWLGIARLHPRYEPSSGWRRDPREPWRYTLGRRDPPKDLPPSDSTTLVRTLNIYWQCCDCYESGGSGCSPTMMVYEETGGGA
jgi:RHS repeat-associated protein